MAALTADTILLQRYHLIAPVADRGLGETWEGVDARIDGRRVLVKLLDPSADDVRKKVVAGLQALRMFRHPGALAVTDHGVYEGRPFVVHDLPQVGSLASLLDRHRAGELELPLDKIAALVARLAEVVQAGHEEPEALVHGALRPRAVLVPDDLEPTQMVLLDAGLRNLAQDPDAPKESAAAARCLTPEQFAGEALTPRTDTFALGLLLLEILRAPPSPTAPAGARYLGRPDVPDAVWDAVLLATRIPVAERPSIEAFLELLTPAWTAPPAVVEPTDRVSLPPPAPAPAAPAPAADDVAAFVAAPLAAAAMMAPRPDIEDAPRYEPRSSIPPGGILGAMPSLSGPVADEYIDFGERTVALSEAPDLPGFSAPVDPLGSTRTVAPRVREEAVEFPEERTIVAFSARMQAVEDMLSTVERALPPELDDVAARFRAQMAASKRREETAPKGMSLSAPRRPAEPAVAAPAPVAPAPPAEPAKRPPVAAIAAALAVLVALLVALLLRR